jgi:hypothetical protein
MATPTLFEGRKDGNLLGYGTTPATSSAAPHAGGALTVPFGTRHAYCYEPVLPTASTQSPQYTVDGTNWVTFKVNDLIDGGSLPSASDSGGKRWGFQLPYYDKNLQVGVTSATTAATTQDFRWVFTR